ncbi:hypothetical protein HZS_7735 [Henneguya salminicola]|nr:hypothetical protein HZS_7735 [Henneguya salminicola]
MLFLSQYFGNQVYLKNDNIGKSKPLAEKSIRLERNDTLEGAGSTIVYNYQMGLSILQQKLRLPVYKVRILIFIKYRTHILYLLEKYQTLVIMGQTGCGKSTQIPQYLHEAGWTKKGYMIAITQPRRVAAISVASRVSDEMSSEIGDLCGYSIRFDDCSTPGVTKLRVLMFFFRSKFMTDGFLVREMMRDPLLSQYSVIIVDEAHERTIHTDIVLGLLKKLRLIVSSATINAEEFAAFFDLSKSINSTVKVSTSTILTIEQRMFPLDIFYLEKSCPNYMEEAVKTALEIHQHEGRGDILAFLTSQNEIDNAVSLLNEHKDIKNKSGETLLVLPLYGSLPIQDQIKVFHSPPVGIRKVIFSTNIAEASVTIHGICFGIVVSLNQVIDSGFCKMNFYNPDTNIETLIVTEISKDSAIQRAGRAGRTRPGKVYRLYREHDFNKLPDHTLPEIQRQEMSSLILQLLGLGVEKVISFSFISPPSVNSMANGIQQLYALKCIDDNCQLTDPLGRQMVEFPLDPMIGKMLLGSSFIFG